MSSSARIWKSGGWLLLSLMVVGCSPAPQEASSEPFEVAEATIAELRSAIRSGQVTCRQVVQAYLDRIAAYDETLGAITVVHPGALERADELDRRLEAGEEPGPLFCAPILVKDNFDTFDLPTTAGSEVLKESIPPDDAFMVRRIREAGAVVLAKTNMAEWAFSPRQTVSSSYGTTVNAYDLERVPAGSSGGTASGVAASLGVAGLGTDTGNSIRGPASHLALFGLRSTLGLTSRDGVVPLAFDRDIAGPLTRTVEDGARLFDVIAGHDPADSFSEDGKREESYLDRLRADGLQGTKIGVLRALAQPQSSDPEVLALFDEAIEDLRGAGAEIVDPVEIEGLEDLLNMGSFCRRFRFDMWVYLESLGPDAPIRDVREALESGRYAPYIQEAFEFFADGPLDVPPEEWEPPCPPGLEHPARRIFHDAVVAAMDEAGIAALVYPTWTYPPALLELAKDDYLGDNSQLIAPATGMPAATVPMGFTKGGTLPAGLQILGRRFDDGLLIQLSYAYEQATLHHEPPAGFPPL